MFSDALPQSLRPTRILRRISPSQYAGVMNAKRAIIYARWSSKEQSQGSTLARQLDACEAYATANGLEIAERMCDRVAIISGGQVIATGTMDELRAGHTGASLEDIFLELTGGSEEAEIAAALA